ncbi:rhodanese-like domain-containing protein [Phormidesmis sp. 146-35]
MNPFDRLSWSALNLLIRTQFPRVRHLSVGELENWLESDRKPHLLDARTEAEYNVSHLDNAQRINPDIHDFSDLKLSLETSIVVYCSVGYRSARVVDRLQQAGFTQVMNLEGSIFEWANQGKPIYAQGQRVQRVHLYSPAWGYLLKDDLRALSDNQE